VWDGRLTSFLVLLFLYFGYIALAGAAQRDAQAGEGASRVTAIFGLVGAINIPIINRSVVWWNSLHQPPSITIGKSAIDGTFLWPLLIAAIGFSCIFGGVVLARMRRCWPTSRPRRACAARRWADAAREGRMHERLDQWDYVAAALAIGVIGTLLLVGWTLWAMVRAERRRDRARGK
jgi:hypothetical protein